MYQLVDWAPAQTYNNKPPPGTVERDWDWGGEPRAGWLTDCLPDGRRRE